MDFASVPFADFRQTIDDLARTPLSKITVFVVALTVLRLALYPLLKVEPHKRGATHAFAKLGTEVCDAFVYAAVFIFMVIRPFVLQAFVIPSGSMWSTLHVGDFIIANKAIYRYSDPKAGEVVVFRPPIDATLGHKEQLDENGDVKVDFIKRCIGTPGDLIELKEGVLYRNGKRVEEPYKRLSTCADTAQSPDGNCQTFRSLGVAEAEAFPKASFKLVKTPKGEIVPLNYTALDANSPIPERLSFSEVARAYVVAPRFNLPPAVDGKPSPEAAKAMALPAEKIPAGHYLMMGDNRNNSFDGRGWGLITREQIVGRSEVIWLPFSRWGRTPREMGR